MSTRIGTHNGVYAGDPNLGTKYMMANNLKLLRIQRRLSQDSAAELMNTTKISSSNLTRHSQIIR